MPRHPPIALKTLDRSHCQYPPRDLEEIVAQRDPKGIVASAKSCAGLSLDAIGTKRPASRDRFEGAVRQTHHMREIERLPRQITSLFGEYEVRTNLLFTMSYRTGGKPRSSPQTLKRMTFSRPSPSLLDTLSSGEEATILADCAATILRIARRWWSRTGSNRRHPACKAGALPAELRPLIPFVEEWWAWEDLNLRPHAYQARALTN